MEIVCRVQVVATYIIAISEIGTVRQHACLLDFIIEPLLIRRNVVLHLLVLLE